MKDNLGQAILEIMESGSIVFTNHAKDRMGMRGYTVQDVLKILSTGTIARMDEERAGRFRCEITGMDINDEPGTIIALVIRRARIIIITVLGGV